MVLCDNLVLYILTIVSASLILIVLFYKRKFRYWKDLSVEHIEPSIPFGNSADVMFRKVTNSDWFQNYYSYLKSKKAKFGGSYFLFSPAFIPVDLDLIKQIMQTDFVHFTDHGAYINEKDDPLTGHLFSLGGQKWRNLRTKLTPVFTSGKMKNMVPIMIKISEELVKMLENESSNGNPIESKDIAARFTTDIIGNCAFGLECNSLVDPNTEFRVKGRRILKLTWSETMKNFLAFLFPETSKFLGIRVLPKESSDFLLKVVRDAVDYRERTGFQRNDALQLLIELKDKNDGDNAENTLTFNELAAQAFVFFLGGFETSSTLMSFALLELAMQKDVQDKLREEINTVLKRNNNELTYTALQEMKYLDMVVSEALRKYPPLPALNRVCTKDYRVPNTDIVLKKGSIVLIPVQGIHYDPEYYPNPEVFDPNRFNEENKNNRHQYAYLPFGEGPRMCIGIRFGMMQARIGLAAVIRNFRVTVDPKTTLPVKLDPQYFFTTALGDVLLALEKIN